MLPVLRYYTVFNVEQCEGFDVPAVPAAAHPHEPLAAAEEVWSGWTDKPALLHQGNAAFYRREADSIMERTWRI